MAYRVEVPWRRLGLAERNMSRQLRKEVGKAMKTAARQCVPVLVARTMDAPPASANGKAGAYAYGRLVKGWNIDTSEKDLLTTIFNTEDYAQFVEDGVKAKPMGTARRLTAAARSVMRRLIGRAGTKPKAVGSFLTNLELWVNVKMGLSGPPARRMAKRIMFAMKRRTGMMLLPRHIVRRAYPRIVEIHGKRLAEALYRAARDGVDSAR